MIEKEEFIGCKHIAYGMNGVGKQTNFIHYSIKRCVIKRVDDGKGIRRRLIRTHHPKKLQRKRKEGRQVVEQPCSQSNHSWSKLKVW